MLKCPFYNDYNACQTHSDCLFLRKGGCAIVLAATIGEANKEKLENLESEIQNIKSKLHSLKINLEDQFRKLVDSQK